MTLASARFHVSAPVMALGLAALLPHSHALTIELDYSYDTNKFFNQPGAKQALRAAADFYESVITDNLSAIEPSGDNTWSITFWHPGTDELFTLDNPTLPADTIRIYVGGLPIPGPSLAYGGFGGWDASGHPDWTEQVQTRGQPGGGTTSGSDFTPWGGAIAFDSSESWDFTTTSTGAGGIPFAPIALHEIAHVLGMGTCGAWANLVDGSGTPSFTGPACTSLLGQPVPLEPDTGHFRDDGVCSVHFRDGYDPANPKNLLSRTVALFSTPAGKPQVAISDPVVCPHGTHLKVPTELDLAALDDIGWEITYPPTIPLVTPDLTITRAPGPGPFAVLLSWPSEFGLSYRLEATSNPDTSPFTPISPPIDGDGDTITVTRNNPPNDRRLYRLDVSYAPPPERLTTSPLQTPALPPETRRSAPPVACRDCAAHR